VRRRYVVACGGFDAPFTLIYLTEVAAHCALFEETASGVVVSLGKFVSQRSPASTLHGPCAISQR
jgi:hypothetical protein